MGTIDSKKCVWLNDHAFFARIEKTEKYVIGVVTPGDHWNSLITFKSKGAVRRFLIIMEGALAKIQDQEVSTREETEEPIQFNPLAPNILSIIEDIIEESERSAG